MFILGFPVPVYTPCAYRDLSYWQRSGVNTERPPGGRSVFVLDGVAQISRRVHPLFVPCSPGGLHPATFQTDSGLGWTRNVLRRTCRVFRPVWKGYYAAVNGNLDPTLSKGRQAFGVNSTSHLHLQKIEVGWIFTLFIFGRSESAPYLSVGYGESLPNHANCIRQCVNIRLKT